MELDEAIRIVDRTITDEWKQMTPAQKQAFDLVINAILDKREESNGPDDQEEG